jgi:hypothetical protein
VLAFGNEPVDFYPLEHAENVSRVSSCAPVKIPWERRPLTCSFGYREEARQRRAFVRLKAHVVREVEVLFRYALSGL